jgi:hypothetical protein
MGHRTRKIAAVAVAALAVTTACSDGNGGSSAGGSTGDTDTPKTIASADEVIKIADKGFITFPYEVPGVESDHVSYGYVIENVSDEVAITVRVRVEFTDEAGNPIPDIGKEDEYSAVLPGQQMGGGDTEPYNDNGSDEKIPAPAGMDVRVTMISHLDTPDGKRYRKPPAPYAELTTGDPVATPIHKKNVLNQPVSVEVTNTYDIPLKPKVTAVIRDAEGLIVGGLDSEPHAQEIQPGDSAQAEFFDRELRSPRVAEGTIECYADPNLGRMITGTPVWHDI